MSRSQTLAFLGVIAVLAGLDRLQSLPTALFSYDTSEPWSRFMGTTVLGFVAVIPTALFVLGVWLALGALRKRVGIPLLPGEPSKATRNDMLVSGLGLGALAYAALQLNSLLPSKGLPHPPTTQLDRAMPMFDNLAGMPASVLMTVASVAIPILVVAGLTKRWSLRVLMGLVIVALASAGAFALAPAGESDAMKVIAIALGVAVIVFAVRAWGTLSAWSWIVAALVFHVLSGLRLAAYPPTAQERIAGVLMVVVAGGLVALVASLTMTVWPSTQPAPLSPET
jgi:hypothetical protein